MACVTYSMSRGGERQSCDIPMRYFLISIIFRTGSIFSWRDTLEKVNFSSFSLLLFSILTLQFSGELNNDIFQSIAISLNSDRKTRCFDDARASFLLSLACLLSEVVVFFTMSLDSSRSKTHVRVHVHVQYPGQVVSDTLALWYHPSSPPSVTIETCILWEINYRPS